jgi:integrase
MRQVKPHTGADGITTYRVRFRHAGRQTSETFVHEVDAKRFAALLEHGVPEALTWLAARRAGEVSGWTFATWFEHYVDHLTGIEPRTRADYRSQHERYFAHLDDLELSMVTKAHVAEIVNTMESAGRAPKTIKNAVQLLASCMGAAVDEGHITRNPAKKVRLPRPVISDEVDDEGEATFLTHEEFARLLIEIPDYWRPLVIFLVGTGLRWSEATALQHRHVDHLAQTVVVRRAWKRIPGEGFRIGRPKTKKSRRTVNPAPQALAAVRPPAGATPRQLDLLFTTELGNYVAYSNFHGRFWRPAVIRASVCPDHLPEGCLCGTWRPKRCPVHPGAELVRACGCPGTVPSRPGIHALRHTHASWLISLGVTLEQVQDQLGHESIVTTRSIYGHLMPALGAQVAAAAGNALAMGGTPLEQVADLMPALPAGDAGTPVRPGGGVAAAS